MGLPNPLPRPPVDDELLAGLATIAHDMRANRAFSEAEALLVVDNLPELLDELVAWRSFGLATRARSRRVLASLTHQGGNLHRLPGRDG